MLMVGAGLLAQREWKLAALDLMERPVQPWSPVFQPIDTDQHIDPTLLDYSDIQKRPVFSVTRRPFVPAPAVAQIDPSEAVASISPVDPSSPVTPPAITLKGVLLAGNVRKVLVMKVDGSGGYWLRPGHEIEGWKLTHIFPDRVVFEHGKEITEYKLYVDKPAN